MRQTRAVCRLGECVGRRGAAIKEGRIPTLSLESDHYREPSMFIDPWASAAIGGRRVGFAYGSKQRRAFV